MRRRYAGLLGAIQRAVAKAGTMREPLRHFVKVTRSFWPGLFHCYDNPALPRTNNDLEQRFGSYRYHERRATGRKTASASTVRQDLERRRHVRTLGRQFRRHPRAYLRGLERALAGKSGLPP
jgi:hypothetical protein